MRAWIAWRHQYIAISSWCQTTAYLQQGLYSHIRKLSTCNRRGSQVVVGRSRNDDSRWVYSVSRGRVVATNNTTPSQPIGAPCSHINEHVCAKHWGYGRRWLKEKNAAADFVFFLSRHGIDKQQSVLEYWRMLACFKLLWSRFWLFQWWRLLGFHWPPRLQFVQNLWLEFSSKYTAARLSHKISIFSCSLPIPPSRKCHLNWTGETTTYWTYSSDAYHDTSQYQATLQWLPVSSCWVCATHSKTRVLPQRRHRQFDANIDVLHRRMSIRYLLCQLESHLLIRAFQLKTSMTCQHSQWESRQGDCELFMQLL